MQAVISALSCVNMRTMEPVALHCCNSERQLKPFVHGQLCKLCESLSSCIVSCISVQTLIHGAAVDE
jgi:hypothetical protein